MADHPILKDGANGTFRVATDEVVIGGVTVHASRLKLGFGDDGVYLEVADMPGRRLPVFAPVWGDVSEPAWALGGDGSINAVLKAMALQLAAGMPLTGNVGLVNGEGVKGQVGGITANISSQINRPGDSTPYAAGDLVCPVSAAYPTLACARVSGGSFEVRRIRVASDSPNLGGVTMRVRLWGGANAPSYPGGDNGAYQANPNAGSGSNYLGSYSGMFEQFQGKATAILVADWKEALIDLPSGQQNIFWDLQTLDGFTPGAGSFFAITAEVRQD